MKNKMITLYPGFYLMAACAFMIIPIKWFIAWILAAAVHEICHIIALKCMRVKILDISIRWNGTWIETEPVFGLKAIICAIAGPIGNIMLVLMLPVIPRTAICAGLQAVYNLLPMYPTDGGRALYGAVSYFFSERAAKSICGYARIISFLMVLVASCFVAVKTGGVIIPLFLVSLILAKRKKFLAIEDYSEYNSFN